MAWKRPTVAMLRAAEAKAQEVGLWKKDNNTVAAALVAMEARAIAAEDRLNEIQMNQGETVMPDPKLNRPDRDFEAKLASRRKLLERIQRQAETIGELASKSRMIEGERNAALRREKVMDAMLSDMMKERNEARDELHELRHASGYANGAYRRQDGEMIALRAQIVDLRKGKELAEASVSLLREAIKPFTPIVFGQLEGFPGSEQWTALRHVYNATAPSTAGGESNKAQTIPINKVEATKPGSLHEMVMEIRDMMRTALRNEPQY